MSEQDYLVAKAVRLGGIDKALRITRNEDLSNRDLDTRMKQAKGLKVAGSAAGLVVPGAGSLAATMDAERKFRIGRNAKQAEARQMQQHEQRQRVAAAGTGAGLAVAASGIGGLKRAVKHRTVKGPIKFGAGAALAGSAALIGRNEGQRKKKVEEGIWGRVLEKNPGGRS